MDELRCRKKVWRGFHDYQCSRKAIKDGFCKQHHPDAVFAREKKSEELYQKKVEASPWTRLHKALEENRLLKEKIVELEAYIEKVTAL